MKFSRLLTVLAVLVQPTLSIGQSLHDMKPYPAPDAGFTRQVFRVPTTDKEADHKVEILVGKMLTVDCNTHMFSGTLEQRVAEGWGFSYFVLAKVGGPVTTLMACPPDEAKTEAFVQVGGEGFLQRYNSKLPYVIYVPEGFEVRYRIWTASETLGEAASE